MIKSVKNEKGEKRSLKQFVLGDRQEYEILQPFGLEGRTVYTDSDIPTAARGGSRVSVYHPNGRFKYCDYQPISSITSYLKKNGYVKRID